MADLVNKALARAGDPAFGQQGKAQREADRQLLRDLAAELTTLTTLAADVAFYLSRQDVVLDGGNTVSFESLISPGLMERIKKVKP